MIVSEKTEVLARQILEIIPLLMHTVAAELRYLHPLMKPAHFRLLRHLQRTPTSLTELAEHQAVSLPTMSNSVTFMEAQGWVRRTRTADDRRRVVIEITPAGQDMLAQIHHHAEARMASIVGILPVEDQERISQGLLLLRDLFETDNPSSMSCKK